MFAQPLVQAQIKKPIKVAFVRGIHQWPVDSPHKVPVTQKMFPFDDVIMPWGWDMGLFFSVLFWFLSLIKFPRIITMVYFCVCFFYYLLPVASTTSFRIISLVPGIGLPQCQGRIVLKNMCKQTLIIRIDCITILEMTLCVVSATEAMQTFTFASLNILRFGVWLHRVTIGPGNVLLPIQYQANTWTNGDLPSIEPSRTNKKSIRVKSFYSKNAFKTVVCEMSASFSGLKC